MMAMLVAGIDVSVEKQIQIQTVTEEKEVEEGKKTPIKQINLSSILMSRVPK